MTRHRTPATVPFPDQTPLERKVRNVLLDQLAVDEVELTREARLRADLGADSLDVVELVMALETEFEIEISEDSGDALGEGTLGQVFDYLKRRVRVEAAS